MRQIAFYGKGGIGKSTIASHFSYSAAEKGLRVKPLNYQLFTPGIKTTLPGFKSFRTATKS